MKNERDISKNKRSIVSDVEDGVDKAIRSAQILAEAHVVRQDIKNNKNFIMDKKGTYIDTFPSTSKELAEKAVEITEKIKGHVSITNWQVKNLQAGAIEVPDQEKLEAVLKKLSLNQTKKFRRVMKRVSHKITLRSANLFLHWVAKLTDNRPAIKLDVSEKEQRIQNARKAWKELQELADEALKQYKDEKGDFYKRQIGVTTNNHINEDVGHGVPDKA